MNEQELLIEITIPNYRRTYLKSNAMRAKYYEKGNKKLPMKFCDENLYKTQGIREPNGTTYKWKAFPVVRRKVKRFTDYLVDAITEERVIANPEYVGKPNVANINGQAIYNQAISKHDRNNMIGQIKDQFRQYFMNIKPITRFPLIIDVDVYDVLTDNTYANGQRWDMGNRFFPYQKAIEDALTDCGIIPDDNTAYVMAPPRPLFFPIYDENQRKMVVKIYKDNRSIVLDHPQYQDIHKESLR